MAVNSFEATQGTQTALLTDNTGGTAGTLIPVMKISTDGQGTFTNAGIWGGAVTITSGSINGTVNIGNTPNIGTIGTLGLGTITGNLGTIGTLGLGSVVVNTLPNIPGGTIGLVSAIGTIGTLGLGTITGNLGTIGTLGLGSVVVNTLPNIPGGSIVVTTGTIPTLGTMGTLGTISNLGSITNLGQVYNAGTLQAGTLSLGTIIKQSPAPSAGSFTAAGSVVQAGSQFDIAAFDLQGTWVGTTFFEGQIGTSAWFGVSAVSNTGVIGTQTTGNGDFFVSLAGLDGVRARLTYSSGTQTYNSRVTSFYNPISVITGGSLGNIGMLNAGTISSLPNLPQGSINVTAGTIATLGTMGTLGTLQNQGSLTNVGQIYNAGTLQAGTIQINQLPTQAITAYGTMGTQGSGTTFFTIQGTVGSGTEAIVSDWSMVVMAGTCGISLSFGTNGGSFVQGTGVIGAGSFPAGGGIAQGVESSLNSGTNGAIYAGLYGNGTAYYHVSYYKATTTV